jgi:hypothetical protein
MRDPVRPFGPSGGRRTSTRNSTGRHRPISPRRRRRVGRRTPERVLEGSPLPCRVVREGVCPVACRGDSPAHAAGCRFRRRSQSPVRVGEHTGSEKTAHARTEDYGSVSTLGHSYSSAIHLNCSQGAIGCRWSIVSNTGTLVAPIRFSRHPHNSLHRSRPDVSATRRKPRGRPPRRSCCGHATPPAVPRRAR